MIILTSLAFLLAIWVCEYISKDLEEKDDKSIVVDEGPQNKILLSSQALAKSLFSDRKPYPGWITSIFFSKTSSLMNEPNSLWNKSLW